MFNLIFSDVIQQMFNLLFGNPKNFKFKRIEVCWEYVNKSRNTEVWQV